MSFQNMANGADCSTGANPMSQLMKQFTQDKSLQRDRFESPQAGPSGQSMRTGRQHAGPADQRMLDEFFNQQESSAGPRAAQRGPAFQFSDLHKELDNIQMGPSPHQQGGWASEFNTMPGGPKLWELNSDEAAAMEQSFQAGMLNREGPPSEWREEFMNNPALSHVGNEQYNEQFEQAFQQHFDWQNEFNLQQDKGKGVGQNATWEQEFAAYDSKPELTDEERIAKEIEEASAAEDTKYFENFESIWQNIKDTSLGPEGFDNDWEDEFANYNHDGADTLKPDLGEYVFEIENPFMNHPDPMSEGLRLLEQGGSLSETALAFEAAVQKSPLDSQAWMHLGNTQAQNEKEEPAIRALEKAVEVDEGNLSALMSLAVSYTNESYDHAAYQTLERWILQRYPDTVPPMAEPTETPFDLHGRVTDMFLAAARAAPADNMDADVQVGLGVLFYGSNEFEKAVDCFVSALKGRPGDYLLWNRLGATLANSGRSEDAIDAYHKALELRPSFVRARYNLGVSCINIGCYQEAAEHLLGALSMHKRSIEDAEEGVNVSSNLWETLRKTFIMMDRRDLADKAMVGTDINQFRDQFEF
ncbi:hypothetical protein INT44_003494 [Umbelopsis vinacea]|uniref:Peroxin-5 n=1 Tax=Umbelopsis vinacea TaxID=44442 RepID=A0A8H7PV64_9FUNG|nr:hypothetical protein INT44_003494 [Umbelopsis vinacea]